MKLGKRYKIEKIAVNKTGMKLRTLGLLPNIVISIERRAPLFGGYYVRFSNKNLGLSKNDFRSLSLVPA